MTEKYYMKENI